MPKGYFKPFTKEQEQQIKDEFLQKPVKRLASEVGCTYGRIMRFLKKNSLEIPKELIEQRKRDSQKKKGDVPFNKGKKQIEFMTPEAIKRSKKTRFKKGNIPHNTNYNGHTRISKDGYVEVRISKGNYRLEHLHKWEQINGKLPESHCLKCIDGNKLNTNPDNWKLITRVELMYQNSHANYPKEIIPSLVMLNKLNKTINQITNGTK